MLRIGTARGRARREAAEIPPPHVESSSHEAIAGREVELAVRRHQPPQPGVDLRARCVQLLDTARAVFAQKGVDGATVKDLSAAAGVAQGLLYHYFPSKEEVLRAALARHYFLPELRRLVSPDRQRPAGEVLVELADGFAGMHHERRPRCR